MTQATPELYEVLYGDLPDPEGKYALMIEEAKGKASVRKERVRGWLSNRARPCLTWTVGALECLVEDLFLASLESDPSIL